MGRQGIGDVCVCVLSSTGEVVLMGENKKTTGRRYPYGGFQNLCRSVNKHCC